ncbi:MAG: hypothetical protein M0C28_45125 [Candidatus Moduliflexus flocculans]|nr:hypothetical protein [Candidatus Moduliflexus flocculans]
MEVREHFYAEDPSRGPVDGKTVLEGVDYFFLGNGRIQAAVQVTAAEGATPVGLAVTDPERFGPKRAALTFDPEKGLAATAVSLLDRGAVYAAHGGSVRARWLPRSVAPRVEVAWHGGRCRVTELFYCPDDRSARLLRRVTVAGPPSGTARIGLRTGVGNRTVEVPLSLRPGAPKSVVFEYRLLRRGGRASVAVRAVDAPVPDAGATTVWSRRRRRPLPRPSPRPLLRRRQVPACRRGLGLGPARRRHLAVQPRMGPRPVLHRPGPGHVRPGGAGPDDVRPPPRRVHRRPGRGHGFEPVPAVAGERVRPERRPALRPGLLRRLDGRPESHRGALEPDRTGRGFHARARVPPRRLGAPLQQPRILGAPRRPRHPPGPGAHPSALRLHGLGRGRAPGRSRRPQAKSRKVGPGRRRPARSHAPVPEVLARRGRRFHQAPGPRRRRPARDLPRGRFDPAARSPALRARAAPGWTRTRRPSCPSPGSSSIRAARSPARPWPRWKRSGTSAGGAAATAATTSLRRPDSPGPWPFASLFVARAALEAGDGAAARRVLDWLGRVPGGRAGSWLEFYGPRPVPPYPQVGIIPWTWAEMIFLFIHHLLGVRPSDGALRLRPRLLAGQERMEADLAVRGRRLECSVRRARRGEAPGFRIGPRRFPYSAGGVSIDLPAGAGRIRVRAVIP